MKIWCSNFVWQCVFLAQTLSGSIIIDHLVTLTWNLWPPNDPTSGIGISKHYLPCCCCYCSCLINIILCMDSNLWPPRWNVRHCSSWAVWTGTKITIYHYHINKIQIKVVQRLKKYICITTLWIDRPFTERSNHFVPWKFTMSVMKKVFFQWSNIFKQKFTKKVNATQTIVTDRGSNPGQDLVVCAACREVEPGQFGLTVTCNEQTQ